MSVLAGVLVFCGCVLARNLLGCYSRKMRRARIKLTIFGLRDLRAAKCAWRHGDVHGNAHGHERDHVHGAMATYMSIYMGPWPCPPPSASPPPYLLSSPRCSSPYPDTHIANNDFPYGNCHRGHAAHQEHRITAKRALRRDIQLWKHTDMKRQWSEEHLHYGPWAALRCAAFLLKKKGALARDAINTPGQDRTGDLKHVRLTAWPLNHWCNDFVPSPSNMRWGVGLALDLWAGRRVRSTLNLLFKKF